MSLNATLLGQMLTFAVFVWFTMKFVWPPVTKAMHERQKKIADGLAAAEQGERDLEIARHKAAEELRDARIKAAEILEQANSRAAQIIEEGKVKSREEGDRLIALAHSDIEQEREEVKQQLRREVVDFAIFGAEKILQKNIDESVQRDLLNNLVAEVEKSA